MNWFLVFLIIYFLFLIFVCVRIIYETRNISKTLAYLLSAVFIPFIGMVFYFSFGINYRKRKMYSKKLVNDNSFAQQIREKIFQYSKSKIAENPEIHDNKELVLILLKNNKSPLTTQNNVEILVNGEQKFPEVIRAIENAKRHIHIQYYIYEDDEIGRTIENLLIKKAEEGVSVKFMYDDFGSSSIRKKLVPRLRNHGVLAYPFHKVLFVAFANRMNYRNHRKIIVVDGEIAFIGGINVSDKYINKENNQHLFWRDTHLKIEGPGVHYLQHLFLCDWNFCAQTQLHANEDFFPRPETLTVKSNKLVQIAASGPDSENPTILFSILQTINLATEELLITTPYFIPGESIIDALMVAALGGVSVKLLIPGISDSKWVNAAASSYYEELLDAGVSIYQYQKGFIHAKTLVSDNKIAVVGTANMDYRSFDLNFEVNAIVYDKEIAIQLRTIFFQDLKDAKKIDPKVWKKRSVFTKMFEKTVRLISPFL